MLTTPILKYKGIIGDPEHGRQIVAVGANGAVFAVPRVIYHSPSGISWGYAGSGPADCALTILAHHFDEQPTRDDLRRGLCRCWSLHQGFKRVFIEGLSINSGFEIEVEQIKQWLEIRQQTEHL